MDPTLIPQVHSYTRSDGFFNLADSQNHICLCSNDERIMHALSNLNRDIAQTAHHTLPIDQCDTLHDKVILIDTTEHRSASEFYTVSISPQRVVIIGAGAAGTFYGIQTLRQIVRTSGVFLPACEITDHPDFSTRGFYHDITRGKVPTLATLKSLVETLAFYKINHLQLYVEHTFAFSAIPELWTGKDPLTADEVRSLDAYCKMHFIDFVPSLATFGHLYELLRLKRFEHLNELPISASSLPHNLWDRMAHYTIDVSQHESFTLIKGMLDEYVPLFSSKYANICCDETFDLGKGKNHKRAQKIGIGKLYVDFVKKLIGVVVSHGKVPMLWGDIVLHHPTLIREFPENTVFLNWAYDREVAATPTETFALAKVRFLNCPGVSGWSRFANDIETASLNIRKMADYGRHFGAQGILTTDWGDCGHVNLLSGSLHGMAFGAALSWNNASYREMNEFDRAFSYLQYADQSGEIALLLRELGSLCSYHFGNLYAWAYDLECMWNKEQEIKTWKMATTERRFERAGEIAKRFKTIAENRFAAKCLSQDIGEFTWSAEAIQWMLLLVGYKKETEFGERDSGWRIPDGQTIIATGASLLERFKTLWLKRNKTSELRNVAAVFETVFSKVKSLQQQGRVPSQSS